MRKVILQEFISLDGLAAGPDGSTDFVPGATEGDQSFGDRQLAFIDSIDTILLGRKTYELFAGYWPNVTDGEDKPFADKLNAIPKVVCSKTLERAPWGRFDDARIASNAIEEVARLKQEEGRNLVIWGSLSLARSLMRERLIDEVQLIVCPVVLGEGTRMFEEVSVQLTLEETTAFDYGTVLLAYSV